MKSQTDTTRRRLAGGVAKIEVTEEMIAAGLAQLPFTADRFLGNMSGEKLVSEVFRAMDSARRQCR